MLPRARLDNLRRLTQRVLEDNVAGDFIETGVWRGGACILMRAVLAAYRVSDRRVFVADSFEGLPEPDKTKNPADKRDHLFAFEELAVSLEQVRDNFARYGLLDDQVVFAKGYFQDTLPKLTNERFALIRLDGDMYGSTMDALTNLYDKLSTNGFVIVDDYGAIRACREAVHDFLDQRHLTPQINKTDETEVWWQKQ
jgi:O-methyltransferase